MRNEQWRVKHVGDRIRDVGEALDALHSVELFDLGSDVFDFFKGRGRVHVAGDEPDHCHIITAEERAHFIIIFFVGIVLGVEILDGTVDA